MCVFSTPWGLRLGQGEAELWGGAAWGGLNSLHCNSTRGGRSQSPAFLQSAVCLHDCCCAGGRWQLHITTPSDNTQRLYLCSSSRQSAQIRILYSLFQMLKVSRFNPSGSEHGNRIRSVCSVTDSHLFHLHQIPRKHVTAPEPALHSAV